MFEGQKEEGGESLVRLDDKEPAPTLWGQVIKWRDEFWIPQGYMPAPASFSPAQGFWNLPTQERCWGRCYKILPVLDQLKWDVTPVLPPHAHADALVMSCSLQPHGL